MAIQSTPHTESQQNTNPAESDLEPDAETFENRDGAQTGSNRAFNKNESQGPKHNMEPATAAEYGTMSTRTPKSDSQGITNHSATEESTRQEKVVSERPDALAGVDQKGDTV